MSLNRFRRWILEFNVFNSGEQDVNLLKKERWSTRTYLTLLSLSFVVLILYTAVEKQTFVITVQRPSYSKFNELVSKYSATLSCPCTNIFVEYEKFVTMEPTFHQVRRCVLLPIEIMFIFRDAWI